MAKMQLRNLTYAAAAILITTKTSIAAPLYSHIHDLKSMSILEKVQESVPSWLGPLEPQPQTPIDNDSLYNDLASPILGSQVGDVTVIEFFDYHCGYCKRVVGDLTALIDRDTGIRLIMKEYPILTEDSARAAKAALAAAKQGRYRAMHEALMAYTGLYSDIALNDIAVGVGVDPERMFSDMELPEISAEIQNNLAMGKRLGFVGTPGFIFGKARVPGAISLSEMQDLVRKARAKRQ